MYRRGWEVVVWGEGVGLQKQPRAASTDAEVAQLAATAHRSNSLSGAAANEHILWSSGEDEHQIAAERSKPTPNRCRMLRNDLTSLQNAAKRH